MKAHDEKEIRETATSYMKALSNNAFVRSMDYTCEDDKESFFDNSSTETLEYDPPESDWDNYDVELSNLEIRGNTARIGMLAKSTETADRMEFELYFVKEEGKWKISELVEREWEE